MSHINLVNDLLFHHRQHTALHFAAGEDHVSIVSYLIEKGANIEATNDEGVR